MPSLPPVTKAFMLLCVGVYCLLTLQSQLEPELELWPVASGLFKPWQVVTYAVVHANFQHLFFNMLGVAMFGIELERTLGSKRMVQLLVAGILTAALTHIAVNLLITPTRVVGASGAMFALLLAYGVLFAERVVEPVFPSIPMKTKYFVIIFGAIELVSGISGRNGVAHFAHLGGMLGAGLMLWTWRQPRRR